MARNRELPRLNINVPQSLNMQQPGQALYSPALPTAVQHSFHPPVPQSAVGSFFPGHGMPMGGPMGGPMAPMGMNSMPPPPGPLRPTHRANQASMQLAAAGIHPPPAMPGTPGFGGPMTPMGGHFPRQSIAGGPATHPFPNRNRRQPSIGGPPKAVLGGPARKLSPLPGTAAAMPPASASKKKHTVLLPKETGEDGVRQEWAREPIPHPEQELEVEWPKEIQTGEQYPPAEVRLHVPGTIDVFLPRMQTWEVLRQQAIEEKLERLGVGSGSNVPHIYAPHARAASISSPADPGLLLFKLNKLQQAQSLTASNSSSLATSPQPPFLTPSPRMFGNGKHGYSMSLAQLPQRHSPAARNPFGPEAVLGFDSKPDSIAEEQEEAEDKAEDEPEAGHIHAPQGRVPVSVSGLSVPPAPAMEKPDFIRGFGLDIPEEEEEEIEQEAEQEIEFAQPEPEIERRVLPEIIHEVDEEMFEGDDDENKENEEPNEDDLLTASQSRHHSRHASRLSAALSFRSFGGLVEEGLKERGGQGLRPREEVEDAMEEWTGTEDVYGGDSSDDESIGEWSNPSDEERARQARAERRLRRRKNIDEHPRRLPDFPRPPENTRVFRPVDPEDDIISNPSEEEHLRAVEYLGGGDYNYNGATLGRSSRPLPPVPIPHSRATSGQHSLHDPARAHSRHSSSQNVGFPEPMSERSHLFSKPNLNPNAKPFVFGVSRLSAGTVNAPAFVPSATLPEPTPDFPVPSTSGTHGRSASFGKPLNAAAQEFRPGGFAFTFSAPQAPAFPTPSQDIGRSLPLPPIESSPFRIPMQGREKRLKRDDDDAEGSSLEEGDTMHSFRFPPATPPRQASEEANKENNGTADSFTFAGFSAAAASTLPQIPKTEQTVDDEPTFNVNESTANAEFGDSTRMAEFSFPTPAKQKRAPIPLDFKHPVSNNTVPAGLFKALVNGNGTDERTRRAVRSRLSSHEVLEQVRRPSLDDLDVPGISLTHKVSRTRLVTDPGNRQVSPTDDVFGRATMTAKKHAQRRSSLPDEKLGLSSGSSSMSEVSSVAAENLTSRLEMHHLERTLDRIFDEKMEKLKRAGGQGLSPQAEAMITEVVALFRSQLQESAARGLEDSQMDARGELDFELIKDVVEQGHERILGLVKRELESALPRVTEARSAVGTTMVIPDMERYSARTVEAVVEVISELSARLESIAHATPARERDAIVDGVVSALHPVVASLQTPPVDYDFLTDQLAQAVKPHISQLIDLASDKRETAGLIIEQLIPLLPSLQQKVDTDAISHKLSAEVRRAIGPIDAFEIKEGVADLVVERLDSRLSVRDKQLNLDALAGKVTDGLSEMKEPVEKLAATLGLISEGQNSLASQQSDLTTSHKEVATLVSELPTKVLSAIDALKAAQEELTARQPANPVSAEQDATVLRIKTIVDELSGTHRTLLDHNGTVATAQQDILRKLEELPESFTSAANVLQNAHAEFALSRDTYRRELEDLRKSNTEFQVQVAKARGAHGQVRVEKDMLSEKLSIVEADRERLRAQVKELQNAASTKDARNAELEEALAKALARLQASDVTVQSNQDKIGELEVVNRELMSERQTLKSKVDSLDLQVAFAVRDKEAAEKALAALQKQFDHLSAQQEHWDNLRHTSEQIDRLTALIGQTDRQELQELRRIRDRSKFMEGEHSALQKRVKELVEHEKQAAEWLKRAREFEDLLEVSKMRLQESEETRSQLAIELSDLKSQLEERDSDERVAQDRESRLRDNVAALESKVQLLQGELERAVVRRGPVAAADKLANNAKAVNGNGYAAETPSRSMSRATTHRRDSSTSTVNGRDTPPASRTSSRPSSHAPPQGYKASMHYRPSPQRSGYDRSRVASPTLSVVSTAPTVDEDGWWS